MNATNNIGYQTNKLSPQIRLLSLLYIQAIKSDSSLNYYNVLYLYQITKYKIQRERRRKKKKKIQNTMPIQPCPKA